MYQSTVGHQGGLGTRKAKLLKYHFLVLLDSLVPNSTGTTIFWSQEEDKWSFYEVKLGQFGKNQENCIFSKFKPNFWPVYVASDASNTSLF